MPDLNRAYKYWIVPNFGKGSFFILASFPSNLNGTQAHDSSGSSIPFKKPLPLKPLNPFTYESAMTGPIV